MSQLKSQQNLATANTVAISKFSELFGGAAPGVGPMLVESMTTGTWTQEVVLGTFAGRMREWLGEKDYTTFEAFKQAITCKKYELTFALDRVTVDYDVSGVVGDMLAKCIAATRANTDDMIIFDALVSNSGDGPTSISGSSLFSTSHTMGSQTYSNKTTSALDFNTVDTALQTMMAYKTGSGDPMGIMPTHMIVGPKLWRKAEDITGGNTRVILVKTDGTVQEEGAGGSTTAAAVGRDNVFKGMTLVIWERLTGTQDDYWYLTDLSKTEKPLLYKEERDWELIEATDSKDRARFDVDQYVWSVEGDKVCVAGAFPLIYGGIVA